jgi:phosphoribosylformimino-5-aminoimidazole carboxamide ribotide isomerase
MIEIIPAISVKYKKVVRINGYNPNDLVLYNHDPLDWAMKLEDAGIQRIVLTDVEGLEQRKVVDTDALEKISGFTSLKVDFGGGIQKEADLRLAFEHGADRVLAASVMEFNQEVFSSWLVTFTPAKIVLNLDIIEGKVLYRQHGQIAETELEQVIEYFYEQGIATVKCAMHGWSIDKAITRYEPLIKKYPEIKFVAATGIKSLDDIKKLQDVGLHGAVLAKALLEEQITLKELKEFIAGNR